MLPAARFLLPVSVSVVILIYNYLRSGRKTEIYEDVSSAHHPSPPPGLGLPPSPSPDLDPAVLDWIRKLDPAVLDWIRKLDPSVVDRFQKFGNPALVDVIQKFGNPALVDVIQKLEEENKNENEKNGNSILPPSDHLDPATLDAVPDEIRKIDPAVLDEFRKLDPTVLDEIRKYDPAVFDEFRKFDPSILDQIWKLCLKGKEKSCNGRGETENKNENENERRSEESDGGGEENKNENGGEVEKKVGDGSSRRRQYPVRPEARDCSFYLKTGTCKFGSNCKFNHPRRRKNNQVSKDNKNEREASAEKPSQTECKVSKDKKNEREASAEKPGQTECKYFRSGGCKKGKACNFNHNRGGSSVAPIPENFLGLPIRPGEKECPYYMQNGSCMYGANCRFNHPDPLAAGESEPPSRYGNGGPASFHGASSSMVAPWSAPRSLNNTPLYGSMMIPPSQGIPSQNTEWDGYQAPAYLPERSMPAPPPYVMSNSVTETNVYEQYPQQKQVEELPERPGQPLCSYFLRMGDCKFKSNCKYHPPKNQSAVSSSCALSDKGLPLRPGQNICPQYSRYGICNSGAACKFDHPSLSTFIL